MCDPVDCARHWQPATGCCPRRTPTVIPLCGTDPLRLPAHIANRAMYAPPAQLVKVYGASGENEHRYSPAEVLDSVPVRVWGKPDPRKICTSHVENENLQLRMCIRRLTRLTNAFSKKWENLKAALALHFAHFNFCRVHGALRVTPAMEAGISEHVWSINELVA